MRTTLTFSAAALALFLSTAARAADVSVIVGGEIKPGVYGRVEIGTNPPPVVLYPRPVIIVGAPASVAPQPVYLHVPPGHAKKWGKHCYKYNACAQPVYFVRGPEYENEGKGKGKGHGKGRHKHDD